MPPTKLLLVLKKILRLQLLVKISRVYRVNLKNRQKKENTKMQVKMKATLSLQKKMLKMCRKVAKSKSHYLNQMSILSSMKRMIKIVESPLQKFRQDTQLTILSLYKKNKKPLITTSAFLTPQTKTRSNSLIMKISLSGVYDQGPQSNKKK